MKHRDENQTDRQKINRESDGADDELRQGDELGRAGDESQRIFFRMAFMDQPFAEVPDQFDEQLDQADQGHDEDDMQRRGGVMPESAHGRVLKNFFEKIR